MHSYSAFHFCLPHVVQFRKISKAITNLIFKKVLLLFIGGKVINVINGKTDTLLEIAVLPLDSYAKPDIEANYQGRLLARQSGFLDPVNYRNHFVTILGTIQGEQPGFINKVPYNFLEVNMQGIQVWHLREVVNTTYNLWDYGYGAFWPEPGWGAPYYTNAVSQVTPELVK